MPRFDKAIKIVLTHEGGYSNDKNDPGGETNFGICKRNYPSIDIKSLTKKEAIEIYRRDYWRSYFDNINDELIAIKLFDLSVNVGHKQATKFIQRACNLLGQNLKSDGSFGNKTLTAINACDAKSLYEFMVEEAEKFYRSLDKPMFLAGWLNRLNQSA